MLDLFRVGYFFDSGNVRLYALRYLVKLKSAMILDYFKGALNVFRGSYQAGGRKAGKREIRKVCRRNFSIFGGFFVSFSKFFSGRESFSYQRKFSFKIRFERFACRFLSLFQSFFYFFWLSFDLFFSSFIKKGGRDG